MQPERIWTEQCEAARGIEDEFGTQRALDYLVGEKFLNFLEAAESHDAFRAEIYRIGNFFCKWTKILKQFAENISLPQTRHLAVSSSFQP